MESFEATVNSENMAGNFETKMRKHKWLSLLSAVNSTPNITALKVSKNLYKSVVLEAWHQDYRHQTSSTGIIGSLTEMHIHVLHPNVNQNPVISLLSKL